ncbi:MAG: hypothetical protein RSG52_05550 [Terrisporobacter sp.]|uniref:hypothetical protein n=1 Tax=Terrisporobacter sp. TaxID=1965305 RepID=UPI002FC67459
MKKFALLFCLLIFVTSIIIGCSNDKGDYSSEAEDNKIYATIETNLEDKEEIGKLLFEKYLKNTFENYINDKNEKVNILKDYKLNKVKLYEEKKESFLIEVEFAVQAIEDYSTVFITGNGVEREDNWVSDKYLIIEIEKVNENKYIMTNLYTG